MSKAKIILWALPAGETDRLHEHPMTSIPLTAAQADKVEEVAGREGWHSFRRVIDDNEVPDFAGAVTGAKRKKR
jgi:hypothetical protein